MRIDRVRVDRFGILAEQEIDALSPGCNIFLGHNEAGKSTTMAFFRAMLFGSNVACLPWTPLWLKAARPAWPGAAFFCTVKQQGT